jgi:signal transduction histidine kinase
MALTAAAAVDAHRAVQSQRTLTARAMREFASFAAWSYGQHLENRMQVMLGESLGAVNHGDNLHEQPPVPQAKNLAHYLPYDPHCECHRTRSGPRPAALFAFEIGQGKLDVAVNTHRDPMQGWEVDRPPMAVLPAGATPNYSPAERRWIVDTITRRTRAVTRPDRGFTVVLGGAPASERRVIAYTLMPTSWGDTMVYGLEYARADFVGVLSDILDNPALLPTTFTARSRNRDVVIARVVDGFGEALFESAPGERSAYDARLELNPLHGDLALNVSVRPQQAGILVFGGLPRSRLPFLLGVLALAATLSVVAVIQLRRETELARMRSDFVANVSHELRTPLAQIRLFTETLRLGRANTPAQRDWSLGHIERETTRLGHLVENVLRFSRAERPDVTNAVPIDAAAEAARIVEEFAPLAASRQVRLETDIAPTPSVSLRPDALRRVLLNLLDNAVKYGPVGQTVRVALADRDGELRLTVEDEGPGVPARERETVWLPFQRGSAGGVAAGSGIGLTLVRDLVTQHGGRAWVESGHEGRGARFVVAFPMRAHVGPGT